MKTFIVLGLGFGDEAKGSTTDFLSFLNPNSLIVRFSGGHQAGHSVELPNGLKHVFHNFGSGTLRGTPTYWSKYCTMEPGGIVREYNKLIEKGVTPRLFIDNRCPVVTPYDISANRQKEKRSKHGTCGVGFGKTIKRQEGKYKLFAADLLFPEILKLKMEGIAEYYFNQQVYISNHELDAFYKYVKEFNKIQFIQVVNNFEQVLYHNNIEIYESIIFEGSQGILLDMEHGFYPHVTRGKTTSHNAMEIIKEFKLPLPDVYYVTRAYQTRHGNGPMFNEDIKDGILYNLNETNVYNVYQGEFRKALLNINALKFALQCDAPYEKNNKYLVITCLDHMPKLKVVNNDKIEELDLPVHLGLLLETDFRNYVLSESPISEKMKYNY